MQVAAPVAKLFKPSNKYGTCEFPHDLPNVWRLTILEN